MSTSLSLLSDSPALLPASLAPAVLANQADQLPVREHTHTELIFLIGDLLNGAALLMGHRSALEEVDDLDLMANGVAAMIRRRFSTFKPAELSEAFQRGASGEYRADPKDLFNVSLPVITGWLEGYQRTARASVVALLRAQEAKPLALPAPAIDYVGSVLDYVALARAGELPRGFELDLGNVLYTWLKETGALTGFRTAEQYATIRQEETDRLLSRSIPASGAERREYTSFVNVLADQGELPESHPLSRSVLNACKKRVLREWLEYFARYEESDRVLDEFLSDPNHYCACFRAEGFEVCPDCHDSGRKQLNQAA